TGDGVKTLEEGDLVRVPASHADGDGLDGHLYRYRGFAKFLSTDGGSDAGTPETDDDTSLLLPTGTLIADIDDNGHKTIYKVVGTGLSVGPGETIRGKYNLATDSRFAVHQVNLGTEDFTNTKFWAIDSYDTNEGTQVLADGDVVHVLAGHEGGGAEGRAYRYRGYADFLSTDGGSDNDTDDTEDDDVTLHLLTGTLIAAFDADGHKTIYELVEADHTEEDETWLAVGPGETIDSLFDLAHD